MAYMACASNVKYSTVQAERGEQQNRIDLCIVHQVLYYIKLDCLGPWHRQVHGGAEPSEVDKASGLSKQCMIISDSLHTVYCIA